MPRHQRGFTVSYCSARLGSHGQTADACARGDTKCAQFYRWHGELEAARTAEAEGKFREYAAALGGHLATCDALLALVRGYRHRVG